MPLVKDPRYDEGPKEAITEEAIAEYTVREPVPDDINEVILRVMNILKYYNVERLEITKDYIYFRHFPNINVGESVVKWFLENRRD